MPGQGGSGFNSDADAQALRLEVDRALAAARVEPADAIWGPTAASFRFGELPGDKLRLGGPIHWVERALKLHFFIGHDNRPSTQEEVDRWLATLTPNDVAEAVRFAIEVGLP